MKTEIINAVTTNRTYLISLISEMVRFASYSGEVEEIQRYLQMKMDELGLATELVKVDPVKLDKYKGFSYDGYPYERRYSLLGRQRGNGSAARGNRGGRSLILNGHIDIVPPGDLARWDNQPLSGHYEAGKIFGRGALDMKAGLAAAITAVKVFRDLGLQNRGDITIASVCGEETGGCGAFALIEHGLQADGCIILEPTKKNICHIQSGCHTFKLTLKGFSIHACMAYKGVNVIDKFILIYEALKDLDIKRHQRYAADASGQVKHYENPENVAPLNVGLLQAGEWPSSVPDCLEAHGRAGIFPGETVEDMHREFEETVYSAARQDPWLADHLPGIEWYEGLFEPAVLKDDHDLIQVLSDSHSNMSGMAPRLEAVTYGSDLRIFALYGGIPTILYGPGDVSLAHTVNEYIEVNEVMDVVCSLVQMLINWCGTV